MVTRRISVSMSWVAAIVVGLCAACEPSVRYARVSPRSFRLPPEMVPPNKDDALKLYGPLQPYTVRVAERGRVWAAELPQVPGPFEMTIPLDADASMPTRMAELNPDTEAKVQRYLLGVARVKDLSATGRTELALVVLDEVIAEFPKEERLWVMKGTLHRRSGQPGLAREAWRKALELAPADTEVAEALRALDSEAQP